MKIREKLYITLFVGIIIIIVFLYMRFVDEQSKINLYIYGIENESESNYKIIKELNAAHFANHVLDYTLWDAMVDFSITGQDSAWAIENIDESAIGIFEFDYAWVFSPEGKLLHTAQKSNTKTDIALIGGQKLLDAFRGNKLFHFYTTENNEIVEIFGSRIFRINDSERKEPFGYYFVGKRWDESYLQKMSTIANCTIVVNAEKTASQNKQTDTILHFVEIPLISYNSDTVAYENGYKSFNSLQQVKTSSQRSIWVIVFFSFFVVLITVMLSRVWIFKPLRAVSDALSKDETYKLLPYYKKNDEFAEIALLIQKFLQQREELETINNDLIEKQNLLAKKNADLQASITYAKKIQIALLKSADEVKSIITDYFVMLKPKETVSGDFYFFKVIDNKLIAVAADCTGHGVPGAFMSMLGTSLLNEIIVRQEIFEPTEILELMRAHVKEALKQTTDHASQKDGMDMALCVIEKDTLLAKFAGAYRPLWLVRNNELTEYKSTPNPIGVFVKETHFKQTEIQLQPNDIIYMFSDGYTDQFGRENMEKFKPGRFKKLLVSIHQLPMQQQHEKLRDEHIQWKGEHNQIDDILIMGLKI